jgi:predicted HAD superfamily Cof-like phosphohydrolase
MRENLNTKARAFHKKLGLLTDYPSFDGYMFTTLMGPVFNVLTQYAENAKHSDEFIERRTSLLAEELAEFMEALVDGDREKIAKEGADLMYVIVGTLDILGIDAEAAFDLVHKSNMTKSYGYDITNRDKGPDYQEPDMKQCIIK